jgi:hypothetical protein
VGWTINFLSFISNCGDIFRLNGTNNDPAVDCGNEIFFDAIMKIFKKAIIV